MRVEVVRARELTEAYFNGWRTIQAGNAGLQSPFFTPEFALAVAAERDDAFVALIEEAGTVQGFFPFHRGADGAGLPIGLRISDYHGLIAADSSAWDVENLLRACGLKRWDFRAVPVSQKIFEPWHSTVSSTVSIDLAQGFRHYHDWLTTSGSHLPERLTARRRQAEREAGAVRFTWHSNDPDALRTLLECKSAQYRRTGTPDVFQSQWITNVLGRLHRSGGSGGRGVLSELRAGDRLMAAHFGMRSATVLHYWFPCYRQAFARFSPGLMLLMEIARHAAAEGISTIDMGFSKAAYKDRFATSSGMVGRGSVIL